MIYSGQASWYAQKLKTRLIRSKGQDKRDRIKRGLLHSRTGLHLNKYTYLGYILENIGHDRCQTVNGNTLLVSHWRTRHTTKVCRFLFHKGHMDILDPRPRCGWSRCTTDQLAASYFLAILELCHWTMDSKKCDTGVNNRHGNEAGDSILEYVHDPKPKSMEYFKSSLNSQFGLLL